MLKIALATSASLIGRPFATELYSPGAAYESTFSFILRSISLSMYIIEEIVNVYTVYFPHKRFCSCRVFYALI